MKTSILPNLPNGEDAASPVTERTLTGKSEAAKPATGAGVHQWLFAAARARVCCGAGAGVRIDAAGRDAARSVSHTLFKNPARIPSGGLTRSNCAAP